MSVYLVRPAYSSWTYDILVLEVNCILTTRSTNYTTQKACIASSLHAYIKDSDYLLQQALAFFTYPYIVG